MPPLMIFWKKVLFVFLLVAIAGLLPVIARATDIEPHVLPVQFSAKASGPATIYFGIYAEGSIPLTFETVSSSETSSNVAMLKPGKQYWVDFQVSGSAEHWVSFVPPSGYQLYINGIPRDHFHHSAGAHPQDYFPIELRPVVGMGFLDAGTFSGIDIGQAIAWELGAGGLRSGHSVNRISFRQFDLTGNPASRDKLLYTPPIGTWQVNVIRDGPSSQVLRQIASPMKVLDFVDDVSGGYWVKYYNYDDTDLISGMYVPKAGKMPWKTIRVESPAVGQLKITETEGSATKVSLLTLTSQPPATLATGGTVTSSGGYTRHTFTSSGTFTPNIPLTVEYLVVAAGGGGGGKNRGSGGGGGGAIVYNASASVSSATSVTVGAGGAVGNGSTRGSNGGDSSFGAATANGGGGGGGNPSGLSGGNGGTGGGAANGNTTGGTGSQGYGGGTGTIDSLGYGAGGSGGTMASAGFNAWGGGAAWGVTGVAYSISGSSTYYGGSGAGGYDGSSGVASGGNGGGGNGADWFTNATAGAANTGGGGGGGNAQSNGSAGGSGIVIVKYPSTVTTGTVATGTYTWKLEEGDGTTVLRTTTYDSVKSGSTREVMVTVRTGGSSGTIVSETKYIYTTTTITSGGGSFSYEDLTQVIANPNGGANALTTTFDYYATSTDLGNYRRIKSVTRPSGDWESYVYFDDWDRRGQVKFRYQPFLSSPSTADFTGTGVRIAYEYTTDPNTDRVSRPWLEEFAVNGVKIRKTILTYDNSANSGSIRLKADVDSYRDASNYQRARQESIDFASGNIDESGEPYLIKNPDSSQVSFGRAGGNYDPSTKAFTFSGGYEWRELKVNGSTSSSGADSVSSYDSQSFAQIYLIPNKSTIEVTIRNVAGYVVRTETRIYTGSGAWSAPIATEDFTYDPACRLTQRVTNTGATTTYTYTNGRVSSTVDPSGTETQFTYDAVGRVATSVKKGAAASGSYAAQSDITTTYTYDGANRVTQTVSSGGALSITSTAAYDLAGRMTSATAPGSYTTGYAYSSGGKIATATLPGGATKITETYLDGRPKSQTGTAVVAQYLGYTVNSSTGVITQQVNFGASTSTALAKTTTDWLGRTISEVHPGWNGSDVTSTATYNSNGQLTKTTQPGVADTLYVYDTMGFLTRKGLDLNANGSLDLSSDRITDQSWTFFTASSNWWHRQTTATYATASSSTSTDIGKVETQLTGLPANRFSRQDTYDIFGNVTSSYVDVNRGGKTVTSTTDVPDSSTDVVRIAYNGLAMSAKDQAGNTTTFGYDALGRQSTATDPRTGATTTAYVSGTSQVYTVTDPASIVQATYAYDSAGRVSSVKNALNKYAYTSYTDRNEVYRQWGDTTVPVEYGYDAWGHQTTMKTYRAGTGWTSSTWPASPGTADTTTWAFHEPTGLLSSKTDAAGKAVSYTYTQAGQIATRDWARILTGTTHVKTTYGYSSTTAELTSVDYNDSTPDATLTYNRLGQLTQASLSDGLVTTLDPCICGKLIAEIPDATYFGSRRIDYQLHATADGNKGRVDGYTLKQGSTTEQTLAYGYDASGRFNGVTADSTAFTYAYATNSNLIASITQSGANWTQTRTWLSNRDLLDVMETKISTTSKAKFDYAQDNLGRFTSVAKTGELFSRYGNATQGLDTTWGYNDRSEVTSEQTKLGGSATVLTGRDDVYAYDNAGNRASTSGTTHNTNTANYTTNALNQYTQRTVPGVFDVAGAAGSGTTVTVNGSSTGVTRHGEYFFKGQSQSNNPNPVFATLAVSDGTTTANLPAFTAGTPEAMTCDDDGNLLTDGRWTRTYDAENRLIAMETTSAAYGVGATRQKLEFRYDAFNRRIGKKVYHYASGWVLDSERRFVYDGNNLIAEYDGSLALVRSYAWGLDLSGAREGAGGVGGLLAVKEAGNSYLPMYDGNGNVMGMIKASDGSIAAAYEYDAFGQTLRESGSYTGNPFHFSTKYTDAETGEVYYGRRFYSPSLGRFVNRDPIEERGGINLYAFVGNNGINGIDAMGLTAEDPPIDLDPISTNCHRTITPIGNYGSLVVVSCDNEPTISFFIPSGYVGAPIVPRPPVPEPPKSPEGPSKPETPDDPKVPAPNKLSQKECDGLAEKIANNQRTLASMTGTLSGSSIGDQIKGMLGSAALYTNLGKDVAEFVYEQGKLGLDANGLRAARKGFTAIYKGGGANAIKGVGLFNDGMDAWALYNDIDERDGSMFVSHSASVALNLVGKIPGMGLPVAAGKFIIEGQISRTEEANDLVDISSRAAYAQEQSRNAAIGMANIKSWEKEFADGGCQK